MTFEMVRMGWPNTAAILALALMPALALVAAPAPRAAVAKSEFAGAKGSGAAAICLPETGTKITLASIAPLSVTE